MSGTDLTPGFYIESRLNRPVICSARFVRPFDQLRADPQPGASVEKGSHVSTCEWQAYSLLKSDGYEHGKIKHRFKQWSRFDRAHNILVSTNGIENFWKCVHYKPQIGFEP